MCRYAFKNYKVHFVCFDCRKTFKKPPVEDLAQQNGDWEAFKKIFWNTSSQATKKYREQNKEQVSVFMEKYHNRKEKCPECGELMTNLGLDFKAPKKEKVKEWRIVQGLYKTGKTFLTCGCDGIGYIPKNERDYISYLEKQRATYQERIEKRDALFSIDDLNEYLNRHQELIDLINLELASLGKA